MKKILAFILILCLVALPLVSCNGNGQQNSETKTTDDPNLIDGSKVNELYVGYARRSISPQTETGRILSVHLAGYAGTDRNSETIKDNIYASCTAFRDGEGDTALLYSLDLHSMSIGLSRALRNLISEETGVSADNIILNVTHTHAAPSLSINDSQLDVYEPIFFDAMISAGRLAVDDLTLCTELYAGTIDANGMNAVRRYVREDGSYASINNSFGGSPLADYETEPDDTMPVVRFVREGKKDVILANWAAHCDTVYSGDKTAVSADYISFFRNAVESKLDAYISIHMAASGDVNPMSLLPDAPAFKGTSQYGRDLGFLLIDGLEGLEKLEINADVEMLSSEVKLTVDHSQDSLEKRAQEAINAFNAGDNDTVNAITQELGLDNVYECIAIVSRASLGVYQSLPVSALSIGNVAFGVAPYEMFTQTGRDIKEASDFDLTFVCAYSNGMIGYIPTDYAFDHGQYEVYSCPYEKGSAELLRDEIIKLMSELDN